ncbi:hypothetical protein EVAR_12891_1 [Eumeta japonica]|uniref:Uncharacterized protein n=1 Tax=Eumeta variegata TaxID=151549 RepID=A0A4C1TVP3_EUMVA|nr:hypothetical protein EVAR_12891_1 [Eumeta japonica]
MGEESATLSPGSHFDEKFAFNSRYRSRSQIITRAEGEVDNRAGENVLPRTESELSECEPRDNVALSSPAPQWRVPAACAGAPARLISRPLPGAARLVPQNNFVLVLILTP